ncbi:MAG: CPBP family intramembrane glutamic endopeptidase [Candidatus Kariarchaeaceae archaeon]|jgi:membrane protease YdiL (CAAX protease family)
MSKANVGYFLLVTFVYSYLLWIPSVLEYLGVINLGDLSQGIYFISLLLGGFGPIVGASFTLRKNGMSVRAHLKRIFDISGITLPLLLAALFIPVAINGSSILMGMVLGLEIPPARLPSVWVYLPYLIFTIFLGGGLEEVGWRGYLQNEADQFLGNNVFASIFIGFFWAIWHIPLWFMIWDEHVITPFLGFLFMTMSISVVYGKLYSYSNNMLLAIIFHGSSNAIHAQWYVQYVDQPSSQQPLYWVYVGMNIVAALIIILYDKFLRPTISDPTE